MTEAEAAEAPPPLAPSSERHRSRVKRTRMPVSGDPAWLVSCACGAEWYVRMGPHPLRDAAAAAAAAVRDTHGPHVQNLRHRSRG